MSDSATGSGVILYPGGGAFSSLSDKNKKENFNSINNQDILGKVGQLDISNWNYKSQDEKIRHIGPMAQDFHAAFGLGESDKHIGTNDADGVALAAIQGLLERVKELEQENKNLKTQLTGNSEKLSHLTELVESILANQNQIGSADLALSK